MRVYILCVKSWRMRDAYGVIGGAGLGSHGRRSKWALESKLERTERSRDNES